MLGSPGVKFLEHYYNLYALQFAFLFPVFVCVLIDESIESESSLESQVKTFREKVSVMELRHGTISKFFLGLGSSISKMSWLNTAVFLVAPGSFICDCLDSSYLQSPLWLHREQFSYLGQLHTALCWCCKLVL